MSVSAIEDRARAIGYRLIDVVPQIEDHLLRSWYRYTYLHIKAVSTRASLRYDAKIEPFRIYWIDPDDLEYILPPFPKAKYKYVGRVADGDWDRDRQVFEDSEVYRAFEARFEEGAEWDETEFYNQVVERIQHGKVLWGCRSKLDFEARCDRLDALYESIRENGYKTQAQLVQEGVPEPVDKGRRSIVERIIQDEMTISVGRDGELLFNDGRDRLAIAKLLDLESVPVWILLRHTQWQRFRDVVASGCIERDELVDGLRTHPDLQHL